MSQPEKELKTHLSQQTDILSVELLSDDEQMKLFIKLKKLSETDITEENVTEIIKEKININFIDQDVFKEAIKAANQSDNKKEPLPRRIAKGKPAEPGADGKVLLLAKALDYKQTEKEDNQSGMYELHLFDNIEVNRIIGRIYLPKPGIDGEDAFGKKIAAPGGKAINISYDDTISTEPSENFVILKAKACGYLEKKGDALSIKEELVIKGDIDFRTGNIDFINKIKITGDVGNGFRVRGQQGVHIAGSVQAGSTIQGGSGEVTINGFVIGSRIEAASNINLNNVQESEVETQNWITINKQSADSILRSVGGIEAEKAHIFGGKTLCVIGANIGTLGNPVGHPTKIHISTKSSVSSNYSVLIKKIASHEDAISLLQAHLGPYADNPARIERLLDPHKTKIKDLYKKFDSVKTSLASLKSELKKFTEETVLEDARVTVFKKIHPGTSIECVIKSETKSLEFQDSVTGPKSIVQFEGELKLADSNPIKKPSEKDQKNGEKK